MGLVNKELFADFDWKNGEFNAEQKAFLIEYANDKIERLLRAGKTDTS